MLATTRSFFPAPASTPYGSSFDRAFARLAALSAPVVSRPTFGPTVAGRWTDEGYRLTVDLPGVPERAIDVSVAGRLLTVDVATEELTWKRQLRLPQTLDAEQVTAQYADGRLTITVAKTAAPEARRIAIDTAPTQAALEASETETRDEDRVETAQDANGEATSVTG